MFKWFWLANLWWFASLGFFHESVLANVSVEASTGAQAGPDAEANLDAEAEADVEADVEADASANSCGDVTIASMNWASAEVIGEIDKLILSAGYDCNVQFSQGDALPLLESMIQTGKPDLISELWVNSVSAELDTASRKGHVKVVADLLSDGGEEGFWIPSYIADANPQIKTINDALEHPDLFVVDNDTSADPISGPVLFNCPSDWPCHIATVNLFRALGAEAMGFTLANTGSAAELDASIARAYENTTGWLGYYWAPTAFLGRYEMVKLDMGEHDEQHWNTCIVVAECANPVAGAWPSNRVISVVSDEFFDRSASAIEYVSARQWDNQTVNSLLAWIEANQATGEEAAIHFLTDYEDVWSAWVPQAVYVRVKSALKDV